LRIELSGRTDELAMRAAGGAEAAQVRIRTAHLDTDEHAIMDCFRRSLAGIPVPFGEDQSFDPEHARQMIPGGALFLLAEPVAKSGYACGVTIVAPERSSDVWHVVYSGVDPDYRGHGVAATLKAASMVSAQLEGARSVKTENDESNEPILRVNRKLGMKPSVGYWGLARPVAG
jgi:RimJ/RimL family protein N-acetyltransferase